MTVAGPALRQPTALGDRALAPDLARGAMLLLIVAAADLAARRGARGPFEVLLRRLTYGPGRP